MSRTGCATADTNSLQATDLRIRQPSADAQSLVRARTQLAGVQIPEDVAVIGFDDIEDGRFATPTLSTIAPNKHDIAHLAVDALLHQLDPTGPVPEAHELRAGCALAPVSAPAVPSF